jgi:LDH2 family malate/lactate/ureidoglycolate dehydrogenase
MMAGVTRIYGGNIMLFVVNCLRTVGLTGTDAMTVMIRMLEADYSGADAHGIFRLPQYIRRIKAGGINPNPKITVTKTAPATAMVDGDNGMGHLVMAQVVKTAVETAKETGVAWVGARRSNHAGAAGVYAAEAAADDVAVIYSVVANANHMPMWGGAENLLGTNPIAIGIPTGEEPLVVLDIATTVVSYGTVKAHKLQGKPMPEGWMINAKDGSPLTDSARSAEGLLLPIGGYKGAGLALVLGLLAGTLNGAAFGRDVVDFNNNDTDECNTGHFLIALDISRFMPIDVFKREVDHQLRELRESKRLPGVDAIYFPGELRAQRRSDRQRNGVPLADEVLIQLDNLADELGVAKLARR